MTVQTPLSPRNLQPSWVGSGDRLGGRMPPVSRSAPVQDDQDDDDLPVLAAAVAEPIRPRVWPGL